MRTDFLFTRLAVVAALFLVLGTMVACNDHDDASDGEAVVEVTATTLAGNETSGTDVFATLSLKLQDRSGIASSFFNDVLFTSYTVSNITNPGADIVDGVITTNACPIGGTCELTLELVRGGGAAGTTDAVIVQVRGMDLNGNHVGFTHQIAVPYGVIVVAPGICDTVTSSCGVGNLCIGGPNNGNDCSVNGEFDCDVCTSPPASLGDSCSADTDC